MYFGKSIERIYSMVLVYDAKNALNNHKRYTREKDLGSGTFGIVQLCKDAENRDALVAVKLIPRGERTITDYVESEVKNFRYENLPTCNHRRAVA